MPMLIETPEDYFRGHQGDFFEFAYRGPQNKKAFVKHRGERNAWLKKLLPKRPLIHLGPSEYSGWICGGPTLSATPADESIRQAFLERWTFPSSPWELVEHRYADWHASLTSCNVLESPLHPARCVRYWQLPEGPLLLGQNNAGHHLSRRDAQWWFSHDMPGHRADQRTGIVSGEYYVEQLGDEGKACHVASIDWEEFNELDVAKQLETNPEFIAWLRKTLSIPDEDILQISTWL